MDTALEAEPTTPKEHEKYHLQQRSMLQTPNMTDVVDQRSKNVHHLSNNEGIVTFVRHINFGSKNESNRLIK